jgi:hypothetical protein
MKFELIGEDLGVKIYARIDDDNVCRYTCSENDPSYLRWLNGEEETGTIS